MDAVQQEGLDAEYLNNTFAMHPRCASVLLPTRSLTLRIRLQRRRAIMAQPDADQYIIVDTGSPWPARRSRHRRQQHHLLITSRTCAAPFGQEHDQILKRPAGDQSKLKVW